MAEDPGDGMVGLTWCTKPAIGWPALAAVDDSTVQVGPQFFNASAATPTPRPTGDGTWQNRLHG